jgi:hypothetical protein
VPCAERRLKEVTKFQICSDESRLWGSGPGRGGVVTSVRAYFWFSA